MHHFLTNNIVTAPATGVDFRMKCMRQISLVGLLFSLSVAVADGEIAGNGTGYVPLDNNRPYLHVIHEGRSIKVKRVQDPEYALKGYYAQTIRKCPPFCIHPMQVDPRIKTIGEIEVFDFMEKELRDGKGLLVDARTSAWFKKGTIPGSVNLPFTILDRSTDDSEMVAALELLGAKRRGEIGFFDKLMEDWGLSDTTQLTKDWDFAMAKQLVLWCNGPTCGQSPMAIKGLLAAGYPAEKIFYYRGGMQMWQLWGLTTVVPSKLTSTQQTGRSNDDRG